jgi:hypothetical protein
MRTFCNLLEVTLVAQMGEKQTVDPCDWLYHID